eukprot:gnl/MRDRNA2_/MRDRNA2_28234_c0_seq1.p1 gnl/MRDRNA2_/MRDRNA2_28234_c0~~gnl/MRDRNA2_/MRDRNA2_28234_c0_seq1.p1  ORF type:complete len:171 (+),score=22.02 gnl/MRDRNA2_/MRDRNA2_28234_c0_seq1:52-564(+)
MHSVTAILLLAFVAQVTGVDVESTVKGHDGSVSMSSPSWAAPSRRLSSVSDHLQSLMGLLLPYAKWLRWILLAYPILSRFKWFTMVLLVLGFNPDSFLSRVIEVLQMLHQVADKDHEINFPLEILNKPQVQIMIKNLLATSKLLLDHALVTLRKVRVGLQSDISRNRPAP